MRAAEPVDTALVFVLNMTFDGPIKIISSHLMLMSLVLLAPEARRLVGNLLGGATAASMATFTFRQPAADRLELTGEVEGHPVTISMRRVDPDRFPLSSTGFHWVRDLPAN